MGDYNVAFKYNKRITTDNSAYPWPLNWDKYSLDRKMLNEDLRSGGLVERSRAAAFDQLTNPVTKMRFLQGKGQVEGISLSSLHRRSTLDGSRPMISLKTPVDDSLLFVCMEQQGDNWVDEMNTQDQAQKLHLPLSLGGNRNSEIFEQSVRDTTARSRQRSYSILDQQIMEATATPLVRSPFKNAKGLTDIPPTPAGIRDIKKRQVRTQTQILLDDASRFQANEARRASLTQSHRKLVAEQLLNKAKVVAEPKMRHTQSRLRPTGAFEKQNNETQQEWAKRMRDEVAKVESAVQKLGAQKQRLRALSAHIGREETKAGTQSSQKSAQKPPSNLRRVQSFSERAEEKPAQREREGSHFFEKLPGFISYQLGFS